jgi:ABC-type uncharacterized transport system permease subunit
MDLFLSAAAALAYGVAAALQWRASPRAGGRGSAAAGLALHLAALLGAAFHAGSLTLGVTEALSLFAWQAALLLWVLSLLQPVQVLGLALYPLAALAAVSSVLWPTSISAIPLADWKIQLHVVLSLFSAGFLRLVLALPPLQTMEHVLFMLIALGFFILSLSLLSGLLFVDDLLAQHLAHKTVLSIAAWAMFGALLWGRWRRGWRGRMAVRWTLSGYAVLILAYFGSKIILEQILSRHWT